MHNTHGLSERRLTAGAEMIQSPDVFNGALFYETSHEDAPTDLFRERASALASPFTHHPQQQQIQFTDRQRRTRRAQLTQ